MADSNCTDTNWMTTRTGRQFWPANPHPDDVDFRDIAWALPHVPRFAGHTKFFYSVAQHSLLVSAQLTAEYGSDIGLWGLMHDATEAYIGDIPRPFKNECPQVRVHEKKLMAVIARALDLPELNADERVLLKHFDNRSLITEVQHLMPERALGRWGKWTNQYEPFLAPELYREPPKEVRIQFVNLYFELHAKIGGFTGVDWEEQADDCIESLDSL